MRTIVISTDMEGLIGISRWSQVTPSSPDYDKGIAALRHDLKIVLEIFNGHGYRIEVVDSHWTGNNLQPCDVGDAVLVSGTRMPWGMVEGVQRSDVEGLVLIGYHGCAGSGGVMAHTWDRVFTEVFIDGKLGGEITLATNMARQCGVPLIGVSGDEWACDEARQISGMKTPAAEVKKSLSHESVIHYPIETARENLRLMSMRALEKVKTRSKEPISLNKSKIHQEVIAKFSNHINADRAALVPGTEQIDNITLKYTGTPKDTFDALRVWAMLADV